MSIYITHPRKNLEERIRYKLPLTFNFPYTTLLSRILRSSLNAEGSHCPLIFVEDKIVEIILCVSKIKQSLTVAERLRLINKLI